MNPFALPFGMKRTRGAFTLQAPLLLGICNAAIVRGKQLFICFHFVLSSVSIAILSVHGSIKL